MIKYECPSCGATGQENFNVFQSSHDHRQSNTPSRREQDTDTYHCKTCEENSKGYEVKNRVR